MKTAAPYGSWTSPISAEDLAAGEIRLGDLRVASGRAYWTESRPAQSGRVCVVTVGADQAARDLIPAEFNVRTRVHEYGGAPFVLVGADLVFSNYADQRLYLQRGDAGPVALTPPGYRYADGAPSGRCADLLPGLFPGLVLVREDHTGGGEPNNALVSLALEAGDAGRVLFGGSDFVAYPRASPDGRRLAFVAWDHPAMPWDATTLYVGELGPAGLTNLQAIAGGQDESVLEPQWSVDGSLYFVSDRSGFWNLYRWRDGAVRAVLPREAEFAGPLWTLGQSNYALLDAHRAVARCGEGGVDRLLAIDLEHGSAHAIDTPFVTFDSLQAAGSDRIFAIARSRDQAPAVISVDAISGAHTILRRPRTSTLPADLISQAEPINLQGGEGRTVHALVYPPNNPDACGLEGEKPPLLVQVHGGPTAQSTAALRTEVQFWTSRGFAVMDVDYAGSSGYGRGYRRRLDGTWGVSDVADVVAAARWMIGAGRVDAERVAIRGSSAGGYTVLCALAQSDAFRAGADYYGVSDISALARDTHKFESRYLDSLIGPYPAAQALYDQRSPLNQLDGLTAPLIVFQGAEDPIVPPNQARMIVEALRRRGTPVAYVEFPGEAHGFRRPESIVRALKAELSFYGQVFGFTPADTLDPVPIENLMQS